jgi:hypothetical protein
MGTINPATVEIDPDELNEATALISQDPKNLTLVKLRNGTLIEVYVRLQAGEFESPVIRDLPFEYCWDLSGHSVTDSDYDIMEIR